VATYCAGAVLCCAVLTLLLLLHPLLDAYYYLHYGDGPTMPGIKGLPRSFYELDLQTSQEVIGEPARSVLRMDSLSKFIAPGMRLGWIAGPEAFIQKYQLLQEMTSQFPGGLSQSVFLRMLQDWEEQEASGGIGLHAHVQSMQQHYKDQRDVMVSALQKYLPAGVAEYDIPTAGMFMWLRLKLAQGAPSFEVFKQLAASGVIVVPGGDFFVPGVMGEKQDPSIVRLTFAAASPAQITEGVQRMAKALQNM
jgi:DNA-binding transcriptional MocR family regulator